MKKRINVLDEFSGCLPEEFTAPDHADLATVHKSRVAWDPFPGKPPVRPRSRAGEVIVSPTIKYCIQCGESAVRTDESHDKWGKRRRCDACKADRSLGEFGFRHCMVCGKKFECPPGRRNSTRALCATHRAETDRRKRIVRR